MIFADVIWDIQKLEIYTIFYQVRLSTYSNVSLGLGEAVGVASGVGILEAPIVLSKITEKLIKFNSFSV